MNRLPFRGTLLNTLAVLLGSALGLGLGALLPDTLQPLSLAALGAVTVVQGVRMAIETKNILLVAAALVVGGIVGVLLGIPQGVSGMAEGMRRILGGEGRFNEGLITASVLFCIGPMTLLGCMEDGLEGKIDLLSLKSTLDFVASLFLSISLGPGVMASAAVVLIFQGVLTAAAKQLKPIADEPRMLREMTATGGCILFLIGLNLLDLKKLATEAFLPSLALAPLLAWKMLKEEEG